MNVAELKKRILRGFAEPKLFWIPIKQPDAGIGTLIIQHVLHNTFNADTMSFTDDTVVYRGMRYVILDSEKRVVYSNKKQTPPIELKISLPSGKYTFKIIYSDPGCVAKEKNAEIEIIPNKTVTYAAEFFVDLYKHELLFGCVDGGGFLVTSEYDTSSVEKVGYYKTEKIYRFDHVNNNFTSTPVCHNENVPQLNYPIVEAGVSILGAPMSADIDFNSYYSMRKIIEFMGFGSLHDKNNTNTYIENNGPTISPSKPIFKITTTSIWGSSIMYSQSFTHGFIPTGYDFPSPAFFDEKYYDPERRDYAWLRFGNRDLLKNNSDGYYVLGYRDDEFGYQTLNSNGRLIHGNVSEAGKWIETGTTYIRKFIWDSDEFYNEQAILNKFKNYEVFNSLNVSIIINGVKETDDTFYIYDKDVGEYRYKFGGFTYYSDDYDQY